MRTFLLIYMLLMPIDFLADQAVAVFGGGGRQAYLITGENVLDPEGYMDGYAGGDLEEWISTDQGDTWKFLRDLTPDRSRYPGWRYNNVQPVSQPDGSMVDGLLLFYGWADPKAAQARAFLLHEAGAGQ